jgi:hypothetical protein
VIFRKPIAIIAVVLVICLCFIVALFGFIVDFSSDGGMHGGGVISNCPSFAPHIYNKSTVDISMGYTPPAKTAVLYCTYAIMDSAQKIIDSSLMLHSPFSSDYVISKVLTNLANGNYTYTIYVHYTNGTIYIPLNDTFTVDTNFIEPKLTIISPQNQTYSSNQVDISYNVNSKVLWSYYKLDSLDWMPFSGNITLSGLSSGFHSLGIAVKTEANEHSNYSGEYQAVYFDVNSK